VVYCGGLENRFGLTADGGSNPSLSARTARSVCRRTQCAPSRAAAESFVNSITKLLIGAAAVGIVFAFLWWKGYVRQFADYVQLTREELRKCTWPTWDELKGSTVVVTVSLLLLGGYIVMADFIFNLVERWISKV
jgi:preprotein translocase subunit SecE